MELGKEVYKAFRAQIKKVQTEEAARRNQVQEQKNAKYKVASRSAPCTRRLRCLPLPSDSVGLHSPPPRGMRRVS